MENHERHAVIGFSIAHIDGIVKIWGQKNPAVENHSGAFLYENLN